MLYVYRWLLPLYLGWLLVCCLYKEVYLKKLNVCPFDYTTVAGSGKVGPVNQVNYTSWVAIVTPTDRPKSVRNRSVMELFCGVVCVVILPFDISVDVGAFVIGLSQISSFFSLTLSRLQICRTQQSIAEVTIKLWYTLLINFNVCTWFSWPLRWGWIFFNRRMRHKFYLFCIFLVAKIISVSGKAGFVNHVRNQLSDFRHSASP